MQRKDWSCEAVAHLKADKTHFSVGLLQGKVQPVQRDGAHERVRGAHAVVKKQGVHAQLGKGRYLLRPFHDGQHTLPNCELQNPREGGGLDSPRNRTQWRGGKSRWRGGRSWWMDGGGNP